MPTFGSLFSGIGGLDLGLERAGWECAWQVEIDEWCRRVLSRHWPDVPKWADIKDFLADAESHAGQLQHGERQEVRDEPPVDGSPWAVDLVCGGFPCQPVSLAGKRRGQDDERWLWPEFARTLGLLRPRFALIENVPGLLARGMGDVLRDLAALGFDAEWDCVPAAAVGAPHLRYRVFVVAHAQSDLRGAPRHDRRVSSDGSGPTVADAADAFGGQDGAGEATQQSDGLLPGGIFGRAPTRDDWWAVEPALDRVAHGISRRVDRLRGLGNAVVPQVAEWVGRRILEAS